MFVVRRVPTGAQQRFITQVRRDLVHTFERTVALWRLEEVVEEVGVRQGVGKRVAKIF